MQTSDKCKCGRHEGKPGGCEGILQFGHPCECPCHYTLPDGTLDKGYESLLKSEGYDPKPIPSK
jgi:hypothetical protein